MRASPRAITLAVLLTPIGACVDYLNHRDSVTLAAGDAIHANAAIQTIDPEATASRKKTIEYDGQKIAVAIGAWPAGANGSNGAGGGGYKGNCLYSTDRESNGRLCGGNSAEAQAGGVTPGVGPQGHYPN